MLMMTDAPQLHTAPVQTMSLTSPHTVPLFPGPRDVPGFPIFSHCWLTTISDYMGGGLTNIDKIEDSSQAHLARTQNVNVGGSLQLLTTLFHSVN